MELIIKAAATYGSKAWALIMHLACKMAGSKAVIKAGEQAAVNAADGGTERGGTCLAGRRDDRSHRQLARALSLAAVLAAALALAACGSDKAASRSVGSSVNSETPAAQKKTATEIADAIKAKIPEISKVLTITEDNDPNDKIGRPGGYVDGAVLFDSRAEPSDKEPGAEQGAFLEVWPDEAAATDRSKFIQNALQAADGVMGTEYHYQHKGFLLRVIGDIKPSQAKVYESVFNAQFQGS